MNEYWGKLRWCFDEGSNTDIVDDIGVIDVLDVSMEKSGVSRVEAYIEVVLVLDCN